MKNSEHWIAHNITNTKHRPPGMIWSLCLYVCVCVYSVRKILINKSQRKSALAIHWQSIFPIKCLVICSWNDATNTLQNFHKYYFVCLFNCFEPFICTYKLNVPIISCPALIRIHIHNLKIGMTIFGRIVVFSGHFSSCSHLLPVPAKRTLANFGKTKYYYTFLAMTVTRGTLWLRPLLYM